MKSEKKAELNKLVVNTLECTYRGYTPTARELFCTIECKNPKLVRRGFMSFVKIINQFPMIKNIGIKGMPDRYTIVNIK